MFPPPTGPQLATLRPLFNPRRDVGPHRDPGHVARTANRLNPAAALPPPGLSSPVMEAFFPDAEFVSDW